MCWKAEYVILIMTSTLIAYYTGILIDRSKTSFWKKVYLCISLFVNLGILFAFKYANFIGDSVNSALNHFNLLGSIPHLKVMLPVGISFYTFQTLSYTIDVYRKRTEPEKHIGIFAVYVSFFPQLVAGPIERSSRLLPQFRERKKIEYENVKQGLELVMWGLFKKVVIADLVSISVNNVYAEPQNFSGAILLIATFFFSIQIYCDFSGYSDMAIGIAKIFGYDLMTNFRQPYLSKTVSEFWERWHISLSTWFRDYLYIPLGGNRVPKHRWYMNIFIVFAVSGLWHGANWTFVVWGLLHGFYLVFAAVTKSCREQICRVLLLHKVPKLHSFCKVVTVFMFVLVGWVFFRAQTIKEAVYILANFFDFGGFRIGDLRAFGIPKFEMLISFVSITILFCVDYLSSEGIRLKRYIWEKPVLRYACYSMCFYGIVFFGVFDKVEFIYFQF